MIETVESLADLSLPDDAVVIVDAALPHAEALGPADPIRVDAGESLKTLASVERLAEQVLARRSTRPMTIVAVGGGSVGDAVGFLASVLWRGVDLWHVPSTLLAMVDSAHGGKTAVNLGAAKNQLGTFHPASRVVLVEEFLATLPFPQRRAGLAELVKALWLADVERGYDYEALAAHPFQVVREPLMTALRTAIDVKLAVVERDPREELGIRTFLNFGHTVAHALELEVGLAHGHAVAWGMMAASVLSPLGTSDADALRTALLGLLTPRGVVRNFEDREQFVELVGRDKKTVDGKLRSVLLRAPGEPYVTDELGADDWFDAFRTAVSLVDGTSFTPRCADVTFALEPEIAASKSEMNRALVIGYLSDGAVEIEGTADSDDVDFLRLALERLAGADGEVRVDAGEGGTTLRFLLAVAATRTEPTVIDAAAPLLARPHAALVAALRDAGASIESTGHRFRVVGVEELPETFVVDCSASSQYASAVALVSAGGHRFNLQLRGELASASYFELTLSMLRDAGVGVERRGDRIELDGSNAGPATLRPAPDASSAAVWKVARFLGLPVELPHLAGADRQPDVALDGMLRRLAGDETSHEFDLSHSPDLAPILAIAALAVDAEVRLRGAAHLRAKECDRIGDFARSLRNVGVEIEPRDDGLVVPAGRQSGFEGRFDTRGDHRLAMAAFLLTVVDPGSDVSVDAPHCVSKSYARFWHHVRRLGVRL